MKRTTKARTAGRPQARVGHDTRTQLLDAATELFARQGVAATTFAIIAKQAGVTPAMVHYHFPHRGSLLDAVVEERILPLIESVWSPVQPGEPPAVLIAGLVERLLDQVRHAPWVPSTWMREVLTENGLLRDRLLQRLPFHGIQIVGQSIAQGQAAGTINAEVDPLLFVFSTLGLVMLHCATASFWADTFHRPTPQQPTLQRHITGLLLHGIALPPIVPASSRKYRSRRNA